MSAPGVLEAARISYGMAQLCAPRRLAGLLGVRPSSTAATLTRVLGARHLAQGLALLVVGASAAHRVGAAVDGLHAASLIPIGWRAGGGDVRLAAADGAVAVTFCLLETRVA